MKAPDLVCSYCGARYGAPGSRGMHMSHCPLRHDPTLYTPQRWRPLRRRRWWRAVQSLPPEAFR